MDFSCEKLTDFVQTKAKECRVLVVGDVMLDKYYYGEVTRISPEAPVPITRVTRTTETLGGAANVAHNLALLGCQTFIAGYIGHDYHGESLLNQFTARGIDYRGLVHTEAPTTTKLRVIGGHQQMLRLDFEETSPVGDAYSERLLAFVEQRLEEGLDAVAISDYGKGAVTEQTAAAIIEACNEHGVPVVVDPKGSLWEKYSGADYITPNLKELNNVLPQPINNRDEAVARAARSVMEKFSLKNMLATRSECGLSLITAEETVHIPTKAQEVFDVSGAGDTVVAVFALALAGGLTPAEGAYLANLAASVVVAKLGTYAVSTKELLECLSKLKGN